MPANSSEDGVSYFLPSFVPSKDCVGKHVADARDSVSECSSMVVEILCSINGERQDFVCGQSVPGDVLVDVCRVSSSRDILLFFYIEAAGDGDFLATQTSGEV